MVHVLPAVLRSQYSPDQRCNLRRFVENHDTESFQIHSLHSHGACYDRLHHDRYDGFDLVPTGCCNME